MFNKILKFFFIVFSVLVLVLLNLIILNYFDYPFSKFNFILAILSVLLMYNSKGGVVWYAFFVFFVLDLFSSLDFGIIFFCGTISTLIIYWFFRELFSKQTFWSFMLMTFLFVFVYNILFLSVFGLLNTLFFLSSVAYLVFLKNLFFEIVITVFGASVIYVLVDFISKKINKKYLFN